MNGVKVLLASNSPRRRELLGMVLRRFEIARSKEVDETWPDGMAAAEVPVYLSKLKADAYKDDINDDELIITADTVVIDGGTILGKPRGRDEAIAMLRRLSGHTHTVVTGVSLTMSDRSESFAESTEVTFCPLSEQEIEQYVDLYRPFDKAGAYGIQEWIGAIGISGINGCYYNVMGLPLHALYMSLRRFFIN
ncbi:MAG: Maf family nucleotide pyrophosphatase [Muribaculaceae bacterium]|nr:Maf family nucleotide pyrophosphatase [Muribaculaceae bacterium]